MAKIKNTDFVEIEYTARIKDNNKIFDLTDENLAKKEGLFDKNYSYGPQVICVGQKFIIKGLDDSLIEKKEGDSYKVEIKSQDAFGIKHPELVQVIPETDLLKQKIKPFVGLKLNIGQMVGNVRSVAGGRVTVDFNHPLAGRDLLYEVKIGKIVTDSITKLKCLLYFGLGLKDKYKLDVKDKNVKLTFETKIPDYVKKNFASKVKEIIPEINLEI